MYIVIHIPLLKRGREEYDSLKAKSACFFLSVTYFLLEHSHAHSFAHGLRLLSLHNSSSVE